MIWCSFAAAALRLARIETPRDRRLAGALVLSGLYLIAYGVRRLVT